MDLYNARAIIRTPLWLIAACAVILALSCGLCGYTFYMTDGALYALERSDFAAVGRSSESIAVNSYMYGLSALDCTFGGRALSASDARLFLMTAPGVRYGDTWLTGYESDFSLAEGECAVTVDLADKYGLKLGDSVSAHCFCGREYTVVGILPRSIGLDSMSIFSPGGVCVFAYDRELSENIAGFTPGGLSYISFQPRSMSVPFASLKLKSELVGELGGMRALAYGAMAATAAALVAAGVALGRRQRDDISLFGRQTGGTRLAAYAAVWSVCRYVPPLVLQAAITATAFIWLPPGVGAYALAAGGVLTAVCAALDLCINLIVYRSRYGKR